MATVYTKFNNIRNGRLLEYYNIYGIITDVVHIVTYDRNKINQDEYRMKVNDGTTGEEDLDVTAFVPLNLIPNDAFQKHKIIRFHQLKKGSLKRTGGFYLYGRVGPVSSLLLLDLPTLDSSWSIRYSSVDKYSRSQKDKDIVADLISKADTIIARDQGQHPSTSESPPPNTSTSRGLQREFYQMSATQSTVAASRVPTTREFRSQAAPSSHRLSISACKSPNISFTIAESHENDNDERIAITSTQVEENLQEQPETPDVSHISRHVNQQSHSDQVSPQTKKLVFTKISHLKYGNSYYYNIICQVVSCYKNENDDIFLHVWDGTRNPLRTCFENLDKIDYVYGDRKREKRILADKKLYEVSCFDDHRVSAANLQAGDYIALTNMHFYKPKGFDHPCLAMHGGEGHIRTEYGQTSAGRKVTKITRANAEAYAYIDSLIKTHEPDLPELKDEHDTVDSPQTPSRASTEASFEANNEFVGISQISSTRNHPQHTVTPKQTQTQASTITMDGFTQSGVLISQISTQVAGPSTQNNFNPRSNVSLTPLASTSTTFQRLDTVAHATVPRNQPFSSSAVFAHRPRLLSFDSPDTTEQPPGPKRSRLTQSPQRSQNSFPTQSVSSESENESGSSQYHNAEFRRIEAITESELEDMWVAVENPNFYPSPPYF